jgi:hypothetical protein
MTHVEIECPCVPYVDSRDGTISPGCVGCKGTLRVTSIVRIKQLMLSKWFPPVVKNGLKK